MLIVVLLSYFLLVFLSIKRVKLILYIPFFALFFSCDEKEEKKDKSIEHKEIIISREEVNDIVIDPPKQDGKIIDFQNYYYGKKEVSIYSKPNLASEIIGNLKPYAIVTEAKLTHFYEYSLDDNPKEWIEINTNDVHGFILNEKFYFNKEIVENENSRDTLVIKNEKEFLKALGSNRVIYIDAKELNISEHLKNTKEIPFIDYNTYYKKLNNNPEELRGLQGYYIKHKEYDIKEFVFHGYENLIIKGYNNPVKIKRIVDQDNQFQITNCKHVYFDNIYFEGKNIHKELQYDEGDYLSILEIQNSEAIHFSNGIINAYNSLAINAKNSKDIVLQNTSIQNATDGILYSKNSTVSLNHVYFFKNKNSITSFNEEDNNNSRVEIKNSLVYNNDFTFFLGTGYNKDVDNSLVLDNVIIKNNTFSNGFINNKNSTYMYINRALVEENKISKPIINTSERVQIYFDNSKIKNNISKDSSYMVDYESSHSHRISFHNTQLVSNIGFVEFSPDGPVSDWIFLDKDSYIVNDYLSDATLTKHNRRTFNKVDYIARDIRYDKEKNVLYKSKIVKDGKYSLPTNDLDPSTLCGDCNYFTDMHFNFMRNAYGEIKNGKLEGVWEVVNSKYDSLQVIQELTFKNSILNGKARKYILDKKNAKTLVEEGNILNEKKEGEWIYYYPNGILRKKEHYKNGKQTGSLSLYYLEGTLMEHREHYRYKNGKVSFYYPNGQLESEINYRDYKPTLEGSQFYDENGKKRQGTLTFTIQEKKGLLYKVDVDFKDKKYKDYNIIKGKSYWGYLREYSQMKDGKPFGIQRYEDERIKRYDYKSFYKDISFQFVVEFINETKLTSDKYIFYDNFDLYQTWLYNKETNAMEFTEYNGVYGLPQLKQEYMQLGDSLVRHGKYEKLSKYGLLEINGNYDEGKKVGDWIYRNNDLKPYKKEVYDNGKLVTTERL
ncbi:toxin-antitoxin system YwqK family antitoxin [Tenacibaculum agarivorans]|uniref:hypothetical protein n=1 Tax=Tenacibaculum agarivorans TaxID=1908389 RepID=UPI00094B831F|nr:hypothetical protein [Tenacibaculum agarivorans]